MELEFIKAFDGVKIGDVKNVRNGIGKKLIDNGYAVAYKPKAVKEDKPSEKRETKEFKKTRKTK